MKRDPAEIGLLTAAIKPRAETAQEQKDRLHREWLKSLEIGSDVPPLTPAAIVKSVQTGQGVWRSIDGVLRARQLEAEEAARLKLEGENIQPIPEPIF